ncbi:MAG: hypothetical protein HY291_04855 [Planctomycetes bacterium]|nr:hypothetical protein [Planctomycetota bacterium]
MRHATMFALLLGCLCLLVRAEEPAPKPKEDEPKAAPPKPAEMDEGAKKALENWEKLAYHPGREGVKKAKCGIKATLVSPVYPKPVDGEGKYAWDIDKKDSQASLEWDAEALGVLLRQHGWSAQMLSENYDPDYFQRSLAGSKLTAKAEGERTLIKLEGASASGCKELGFDKNGVMDAMTIEAPAGEGQTVTLRLQLTYEQEDGKYFCKKQHSVMELEGATPEEKKVLETDLQFTYGKVGDFKVWNKAEMKATISGKPLGSSTLEFHDYKFNADAEK